VDPKGFPDWEGAPIALLFDRSFLPFVSNAAEKISVEFPIDDSMFCILSLQFPLASLTNVYVESYRL
jgi:hypothetical protein